MGCVLTSVAPLSPSARLLLQSLRRCGILPALTAVCLNSHVREFWQQVPAALAAKLAAPGAYGLDLELFGYSMQEYFTSIGLPGYLAGHLTAVS